MIARPAGELEGRTLGEFALREKIGEGGFATVHRAFQTALEREAVVKVLHTRLANRPDIIQRFLREARLASRLDHPYAAHVYAFGAETDGTLWIAMELVRGTPMDKLLEQQGPISLDRFVPLFERICEVVQTAHERGIVHRDLKPANVMVLSRAGRLLPKLLDFGIARVLDDAQVAREGEPPVPTNGGGDATQPGASDRTVNDPRPTRAGAVMGSPLYMAPEQWTDAGSVGPPVDIYALGVLAYEALTGRVPFPATSLDEVMVSHARKEPPPLGGDLPKELDAVIARALAKQPADRYGTAGDLASAIRGATGRGDTDALPQLDEPLREAMAAGAPQPLSEAIAALEAARNIDQACAILWDVVLVSTRWIGALALAARTKIGPGGDEDARDVQERLRRLGRGDVGDEDWLLLARALTRPFVRKRDAYPIPELIGLLHGDTDLAITPADSVPGEPGPPFVEAFHRLRTLRGALDRRGGKSDEQRRELYVQALAAIAELLRPLRFVLDYTLIVTRKNRAERWRGLRRSPRPVVVRRARPLPDGEAFLLDVDGSPVLKLAPLVQTAPPAPGKDEELFLFDGRGPNGARLVAVPHGFERHDADLDDWFREHLFDVVDTGDGAAKIAGETAPYRGLATFTSADSSFYFGREKEVDAFANRLRVEPFLAVVGPSGAGKSSFVQAGVVPRLPTGWRAVVVRPGMTPGASLAARLAKHGVDTAGLAADPRLLAERLRAAAAREGSTILLVIDQLEEMFTLCKSAEERAAFAEALVAAATSDEDPVRVVITLRDDFLMRAESEPALRDRLARGMKLLATPAPEDLERIVVEPAKRVGYQFEDRSLVTDMVTEVAGQSGALALLSFTAAELWKLRDRHFHQLSRKSYTAIGGVGGALAKHAETTLAEMSADEQRLTREAFRHLVTAEGTRQVLQLAELQQLLSPRSKRASTDSDAMRGNAVIDQLIAARLLVASEEASEGQAGEARVEIVHEALIKAWPRLERWVREDAEGARMRDQLRAAARQWYERDRPGGLLWRGDVLADLERWRRRPESAAVTEIESAFAEASRREALRARRIRRTALVVAFAGLSVAFGVAMWQRSEAKVERARAVASLAQFNEEQGRQALLAGQSGRALIYFEEAYRLGADSPALQLMTGLAVRPLQARALDLAGHAGKVWAVTYSPDGSKIVSGGEDSIVRIWDARTGALLAKLEGHEAQVLAVAVSPDGRLVATASMDGTGRIWTAEGREVARFAHGGFVTGAEFSPDGLRVVTASWDGTAGIWSTRTGERLAELASDGRIELFDLTFIGPINRAAFSRDGTQVITASEGKTAAVWDAQTGERRARFIRSSAIRLAAFSPDGKLAVASSGEAAWIWDAGTGEELASLIGHVDSIEALEFSPDGTHVLTASADKSARIWDAGTGKLLTSLVGHDGAVRAAAFSPDGARVVTASDDAQVRLWDERDGVLLAVFESHAAVHSIAFSPDGARVATAGWDGRVAVWTAAPSHGLDKLDGGVGGGIASIDVSPDGRRLVVGGTDGAKLWSLTPRAEIATVATKRVVGVQFSRDGRRLVAGSGGATSVWDSATGQPIATLPEPSTDQTITAATSHDGRIAASATTELRTWDVDRGVVLATLDRGASPEFVNALAFSPDGRYLGAGYRTGAIKLFTLDTGVAHPLRGGPSGWINSLAFRPDGRRIVTTHQQPVAIVWDVTSRKMIGRLEGHARNVLAAVYSANGAFIATSGDDRTVKVWDADKLRLLASFGATGAVFGVRITRDGRRLLGAADGPVLMWSLPHTRYGLRAISALARCRVPLRLSDGRPITSPTDPTSCSSASLAVE